MSRAWALLPLLIASVASAQPAKDPAPPPTVAPAPPVAPPAAETAAPPPAPLVMRPPSEVAPERQGTPPLSAGRVVGELAIGAAIGTAGFFGGAVVGAGIEKSNGCTGDWCGLGGAIIGGYLGGSLGVGIGVSLIGNIGDESGSVGAAIGGGFLGGLVALGVGEGVGKATHSDTAGWVVGVSAWPATAVIAFSLTRHWKPGPVTTGSLLRYDHGRASVGVPLVVRSDNAVALSLASGRF